MYVCDYTFLNRDPVNSKSDPVVCRLMNAKVDEYRRKRLAKANSQRKQQKKEIRMKVIRASNEHIVCTGHWDDMCVQHTMVDGFSRLAW